MNPRAQRHAFSLREPAVIIAAPLIPLEIYELAVKFGMTPIIVNLININISE
jgi:uncharacterized membrane protein (DUF2068 family)